MYKAITRRSVRASGRRSFAALRSGIALASPSADPVAVIERLPHKLDLALREWRHDLADQERGLDLSLIEQLL